MAMTISVRPIFVAGFIGALCLAGGLPVTTYASSASAAANDLYKSPSSGNGLAIPKQKAVSGVSETGLYIVQFEQASLARYAGGTDSLRATSPEVTGARRLDARHPDTLAYRGHLRQAQEHFIASASQALSRPVRVAHQYFAALNGVAVEVSHEEAELLVGMTGVKAVYPDQINQITSDVSPGHIGAPAIWTGATGSGLATRGEGVVIGMLGTGINSQHPAFLGTDIDGYVHLNPYGAGIYRGFCAANPGFCNDKLIAAYTFHPNGGSPEDSNGYSSHTASLAAGNRHQATFDVGPTP